ncbi:C-terminal dimerization domain [Abeliophyllum distichum]|uniref:C-terminal dimerization domain n=1 Tax=Abeliophyllum distichum TaxID=126358 RepID=A0ABD1NXW8_9LAMI
MARDLLTPPVSTVASEAAFSISGRVLSDIRALLVFLDNAKNSKHRDLLVSAATSTLLGGRNGRKRIKIEVDIGLWNTPKPETLDPAARENMPEKKKLLSEDEVVQLTNSSCELENEQYTRTGKEAGVK